MGHGEAARHERRQDRRRTGDRHDDATLAGPRCCQLAARVADQRRPGIGHEGQVATGTQVIEQFDLAAPTALRVVAH